MATGCYTPQYLTASFKGVTFWCVQAGVEVGRRGAEGEFPFSEVTGYADLGRRIRKYSIKAVFRENSHIADANALLAALESPGSGTLVHPTLGAVQAACKSARKSDDLEGDQGQSHIDIEFVEANRWIGGTGIVGAGALFGLNIAGLVSAARELFEDAYDFARIPFFSADQVREVAAFTISAIDTSLKVAAGLRDGDDRKFWAVTSELSATSGSPFLLQDVTRVWTAIEGGFRSIEVFGKTPKARIAAYRAVANEVTNARVITGASATVNPIQADAAAARDAIVASVRLLAAAHMARAALEIEIQTMQDGFALYDRIISVLDREWAISIENCNSKLAIAIQSFIPDVQSALLARVYKSPPLIEYAFPGPTFAIVAAYEIFGDARRFPEIEIFNAHHFPLHIGPEVVAPQRTS